MQPADKNAPILLFVFNRPEHTSKTLDALKANFGASSSDLIVFSDGPRSAADEEPIRKVREIIKTSKGFARIDLKERPKNLGLASSIILGVTETLEVHDSAIILEDDLITSRYFLNYMNAGLQRYSQTEAVASIHGWNYPLTPPLPDTFFLRGADCWGWATWSRAWRKFEADGQILLQKLQERNLMKSFDLDGAFQYSQMLIDQIAGRNNSWAIRWYASTYLADMVTLHPGRSLVKNIGLDSTGMNAQPNAAMNAEIFEQEFRDFPPETVENLSMRKKIIEHLRRTSTPNHFRATLQRIAKRLRNSLS